MSNIKVAVRCRPLFDGERPLNGLDVQSRRILLDSKVYDPDFTFGPTSTQDDVFQVCHPILEAVKEGGLNGTIMVYGQTGTGKTFTMLGAGGGKDNGVAHKVIADMLDYVTTKNLSGSQCSLVMSMIEIYNERLTDMLSPQGNEEVTLINGFPRFTKKVVICSMEDANKTVAQGLSWRKTAPTMMNDRSSRSHVVFIIDVEEVNSYTQEAEVRHLFLVDLAGSESLKKSQAVGSVAGETGKINKSLLALKSVFLALSSTNEGNRPSHVPYRDSRLTELLQDSIGGGARTIMIACISSVGRDMEETKSTLMYAVKARSIRNAANTEREKLLVRLRSLETENQRLRNRLEDRITERGGYMVTKDEHQHYQELEEEVGKLRDSVAVMVKESQTSSARQHVTESKTKMLEMAVEEKEAEMLQMRQVYQEAMRRFDMHANQLQRVVRDGVQKAQETAEQLCVEQHSKVEAWRKSWEEATDEPPPSAIDLMAIAAAAAATSSNGSGTLQHQLLSTPSKNEEEDSPALLNSPAPSASFSMPARHGGQVRRHSPTPPPRSSPRRRTAGSLRPAPKASTSVTIPDAEQLTPQRPAPAPAPPAPVGATVTDLIQESDLACYTIMKKLTDAFHSVLQAFHEENHNYREALQQQRVSRQEALSGISAKLVQAVSDSVEQLMQQESKDEKDEERLTYLWESRLRTAAAGMTGSAGSCVPSADLLALQHVTRNLCASTCKRAALLHTPSTAAALPDELAEAFNQIHRSTQRSMLQVAAQQLLPIASLQEDVDHPFLSSTGGLLQQQPFTTDSGGSNHTASSLDHTPQKDAGGGLFSSRQSERFTAGGSTILRVSSVNTCGVSEGKGRPQKRARSGLSDHRQPPPSKRGSTTPPCNSSRSTDSPTPTATGSSSARRRTPVGGAAGGFSRLRTGL